MVGEMAGSGVLWGRGALPLDTDTSMNYIGAEFPFTK